MEQKKNNKTEERVLGQVCIAKPWIDAQKVVPDLAVEIDDMLQTGIVRDSSENENNNGIDNPEAIIGRVRDVFDAMDAARIIKKYGRKPQKAAAEVAQTITNADTQPTND